MKIIIKEFPTHIAKTQNKVKADKLVKLNNQSIYNSNINRFTRNIVMNNLHAYLISQIKPYKNVFLKETIVYPISIHITIETVINHGSIMMRQGKLHWKLPSNKYVPNWDIENLATIWIKAINDVLVKLKFIPDDNIAYVSKITYEYKEIEDFKDRQLTIEIK